MIDLERCSKTLTEDWGPGWVLKSLDLLMPKARLIWILDYEQGKWVVQYKGVVYKIKAFGARYTDEGGPLKVHFELEPYKEPPALHPMCRCTPGYMVDHDPDCQKTGINRRSQDYLDALAYAMGGTGAGKTDYYTIGRVEKRTGSLATDHAFELELKHLRDDVEMEAYEDAARTMEALEIYCLDNVCLPESWGGETP